MFNDAAAVAACASVTGSLVADDTVVVEARPREAPSRLGVDVECVVTALHVPVVPAVIQVKLFNAAVVFVLCAALVHP